MLVYYRSYLSECCDGNGAPARGRLQGLRQEDCTTTLVTETAEYLLTGSATGCALRLFLR